jgi:hypothetical protein
METEMDAETDMETDMKTDMVKDTDMELEYFCWISIRRYSRYCTVWIKYKYKYK